MEKKKKRKKIKKLSLTKETLRELGGQDVKKRSVTQR